MGPALLPALAFVLVHRAPVDTVTSSALASLELPRVLGALARHARTAPGREQCQQAQLAGSADEARSQYVAVTEATLCDPELTPPLLHPLSLEPSIARSRSGEVLEEEALASVGDGLLALAELVEWASEPEAKAACPRLAELGAAAAPPPRLASTLIGAFARVGEGAEERTVLSSDAWPQLARRRAAAVAAEAKLRAKAESLARSDGTPRPTVRDGRLVVPVLPAQMRFVGMEVARSRSGSTVFVEPHALVPLSSAARAAHAAVAAGEARILAALSSLLAAHSGGLREALER